MHTGTVIDVDASGFAAAVEQRSATVPVVVDFWASWCGPCRTLGPMLEDAVGRRGGDVILAKVDVDREQELAQRFAVQGIPAVYGFRDGVVVDRFTGVIPIAQIEAFLDRLAPSATDRALALAMTQAPATARATLEAALVADPADGRLCVALAGLLVEDDPERASALLASHPATPGAEEVRGRLALAAAASMDAGDLRRRADSGDAGAAVQLALARLGRGEVDDALEELLTRLEHTAGGDGSRETLRSGLLEVLTLLGADPRVPAARARMARALF
jgi:putative thioredoxin